MPSIHAKLKNQNAQPLDVLFVIYPNIVLLDLTGPLQVFAGAKRSNSSGGAYRTHIVSMSGGSIPTDTVVSIDTEPLSAWLDRDIHTLVVVGGNGAYSTMQDTKFIQQVSKLAESSTRICSVCAGALILAATGLLDGRRATTHWEDCDQLEREFPAVRVEKDPIYIKDGSVWTSAGITAGIDMALAMVADDLGDQSALELAQLLLAYMVRPGGQSQFSPALSRQMQDKAGRFDDLHQWLEDNLQRPIQMEDLAAQSNMSLRNFQRQYTRQVGITPAKAVELLRIERARTLLETSQASVKQIASQCGFGDEERMRRAFIRETGINPSEYRRRFRIVTTANSVSMR